MKIYPAIDICNGKVVRLKQGDYDKATVYAENPVEIARHFADVGANYIHIVDLDGAKSGNNENFDVISQITALGLKAEVGGGIRDRERIDRYLSAGADRVILGSVAAENPSFAVECAAAYGDRLAVGVDAKDGFVAIHGWRTVTDIRSFDFCARLFEGGVRNVIYTDIACDGMLSGSNVEAYKLLVYEISGLKVIASGGVSSLDEIKMLARLGVDGVILGKAIYTGAILLADALSLEE